MTLEQLFAKVLGIAPANFDEALSQENSPVWDSIKHVALIVALQDHYKIRFSTREIYTLKSFRQAREILQKKGLAL